MVMCQDRSAHDWQICIRAQHVMRELFYKIKQLYKCGTFDLHRCMLTVEHDTVFVIVYVWRILESPLAVINGNRNNPVGLSCRMIPSPCIAFIFKAKLALRISHGCRLSCCCNGFWILFRLGQIDSNIQFPVWAVDLPFLILFNPVTADIISILAELIEPVCGFLRILGIFLTECFLYLCRSRSQAVHQLRIKQVTVCHAICNQLPLYRFIQQIL